MWGIWCFITDKIFLPVLCAIGEFVCNLFHQKNIEPRFVQRKTFIVAEYLSRIEKAGLEILEMREPIDQAIILWWGFDGLRLNEDGSLEWISRKRLKSEKRRPTHGVFTTLPQDVFEELQKQSGCAFQSTQAAGMPQEYRPGYIWYNSPYFSPSYLVQTQNCCCNSIIQR